MPISSSKKAQYFENVMVHRNCIYKHSINKSFIFGKKKSIFSKIGFVPFP